MTGLHAPDTQPIDIDSRLEPMVDDHLIDRMSGDVGLHLHRPVEREIVFTCDRPWEGNFSGSATFIQDNHRYRMFYRGAGWPWNPASSHLCYAESEDGIEWSRPALGLVEHDGSKNNNIVMSGEVSNTFVPFKDGNPDCPPQEWYKAIAKLSEPARGLYTYASTDGIRWRQTSGTPVITKGYFDSQNVSFWDAVRGRYVEFHRELRGEDDAVQRGGPQLGYPGGGWARDVMTSTSPDFRRWSEPQWLQYPGTPREQLYLNQIAPYYRAPHILVGFPGRFMAGREIGPDLPVTSHPSFSYGGVSDTTFMSSRDGVRFNRWTEAFIRPGLRYERWIYPHTFTCYGLLVTASGVPGASDELSMYVLDSGFWTARGRATQIRRYTLRVDGFVSVRARSGGGELVTRPLVFSGSELVLNLSTSAAGSVRIEIQDPTGRAIPGFALADCVEVFGDEIQRVVAFRDGTDVGRLAARPIRLRFVLKDADLYSIRFR